MAKKPASGMYKTKARNLTDAQLKRAKGLKSAAKRTVSISNTTRSTTGQNKGYTLGPGGKRLTGTVIMANGDRAVYKGGKRVTNVPKKVVSSGRSGGSGGSGGGGKTKLTRGQKAAGTRYTAQAAAAKKITTTKKTPPKTFAGSSVSSSSSKTGSSSTGKNWYSQGGGGLFGPNSPFKGNESSKTRANLEKAKAAARAQAKRASGK
jgi:hypothetical protein